MASISNSISASKTIREFLASYKEGYDIKIGTGDGTLIYNVDVIWDGGNYYIAYTTASDGTTVIIKSLDGVLPIQLVKQTTST